MSRVHGGRAERMARALVVCGLLCAACDRHGDHGAGAPDPGGGGPGASAQACGIRAVSLRPTLAGTMLDFRFKVVDAKKAVPVFDRKVKPTLFEPSSGVTLAMPDDTKLGALRAGLRNPPLAGKLYFVLFSNGYGSVKRGSRVTVSLGDCKIEDIAVQ